MTGKERLLNSIKCEEVDRIPFAPFIYKNYVKEFFKDPEVDILEGSVKIHKHFGFDLMLRPFDIGFNHRRFATDSYIIHDETTINENTTTTHTTVSTPDGQLTETVVNEQLSPYHQVAAKTNWLIKTEEDFKLLKKHIGETADMDAVLVKIQRGLMLVGEDGIIAPYIGGVFNTAESLRKVDSLLMDAYLSPNFYQEMMSFCLEKVKSYLKPILETGTQVINLGGNIANGSIAGPNFFSEHVMPYENNLIDFIQSFGAHVLYHNCGDAKVLMPYYNTMPMHAFETLTQPPFADMDLEESLSYFNKNLCLLGNLDQIDFLRSATPEEVYKITMEKLTIGAKRKGFILGTSDFLEENTPDENLHAIMQAVHDFHSND